MFDFQFQKINSTVNIQQNIYGKFLVFPVTNGHGITIGNALRRVLLSDLSGIAIIGVKIIGIKHEFSTIAGIREDVLEILLNLKQVTFTGTLFDNIVVPLEIQGPKIITADNIQLPSNLQIVNPNHYITAICANVFLCMELEIASGTGYKLANPSSCDVKSDFIELDAIFMPVQKVNYYVENIYIKSLKLLSKHEERDMMMVSLCFQKNDCLSLYHQIFILVKSYIYSLFHWNTLSTFFI